MKNIQAVNEAEDRLDQLFIECGWSANHPAMLDWATIKFALQDARQNTVTCSAFGSRGCVCLINRSVRCQDKPCNVLAEHVESDTDKRPQKRHWTVAEAEALIGDADLDDGC